MKIGFKIPKFNIKLTKQMPYILVGLFLAVGIALLVFGYTLFNREPEAAVKTAATQEMDNLTIHISVSKIDKLLNSGYNTSNIKNPGYPTKNPFAGF